MKKRFSAVLVTGLFLLTITGLAQAALITIGTATYSGSDYNLIWDDNNNGNSVIWLDYTNSLENWPTQNTWAAGLNAADVLTYHLDGYQVDWGTNVWRLPSAGVSSKYGFNQTTSEMGDLYYNELGLTGQHGVSAEVLNATNFDNLNRVKYWCTEASLSAAWDFNMFGGLLDCSPKNVVNRYGLAIRTGQVSAVPVPGAIWLLGSGLAGVVALGRRRKGNRV